MLIINAGSSRTYRNKRIREWFDARLETLLTGYTTQAGIFASGLPYRRLGHGPPLVMFRGLTTTVGNPSGLARLAETWMLAPFAHDFTVYALGNRPGLRTSLSMAEIAADHAQTIKAELSGPVSLLGISTGGSIAQQVAVDYPELVDKLILAVAAYRLGTVGREVQHRYATYLLEGQTRAAMRALAPGLVGSLVGQSFLGWLLWLVAPQGRIQNASDLYTLLMAEDRFDLGERLPEIAAPTLVIGGENDRFYPSALVRQTAERIPGARLIMYRGRDHRAVLTDRRFARDVLGFLKNSPSFRQE